MKEKISKDNLRLMVFSSAKELGEKVDKHLLEMYKLDKEKYTFQIDFKELYFEDGHQKIEINEINNDCNFW